MYRILLRIFCTLFLPCIFLFSACTKQGRIVSITEDELFPLAYGNFEDQINLFSINKTGSFKTSLAMRDGFFYIVNGEAEKILSLNSYGDMLSLFYNEDFYGQEEHSLPAKSSADIWKKISYPFNLEGGIAVDPRKYIYAVCSIPKERNEQNETGTLLYSQVVLRISGDGSVIDYIGQQGPGGTPFPFISRIYATENNELVTVCKTNEGLCVYWFAESGFLRYKIPVNTKDVPQLEHETAGLNADDIFVTIQNIVPDCSAHRIYVKVDYYLPYIDADSKVRSGIDYAETFVYPLDAEDGVYGEAMNIPPHEESVAEDFSRLTYRMPYDFLGITKNGWLCFIVTTEEGFSIEMVHSGTHNVIKRQLNINHKEELYYSFALSGEGIISALLAEKNNVRIVWWRTDSLIASLIK
ncbi:MAG: hypothetical protein ACFNKL_02865 [Treponema sp.]